MKIIAFIAVYNEEEIIKKCVENAKEQELDVLVLDNGCTDKTIEIVKSLGIPVFEYKTEKYNVFELNKQAILQAKKIGCDWYVEKDADEMFETYDKKITIKEAVIKADREGYNCMRFDMYEFWPTVIDDPTIEDFTNRIQHYSYYDSRHLKMIKNSSEIHTNDSHRPKGVIKESPDRLILRHYKFISIEQGRKKIKNRLSRFYTHTSKGINKQYNNFIDEDKSYVLEESTYQRLHKFDGTWIKKRVFDGWRGY